MQGDETTIPRERTKRQNGRLPRVGAAFAFVGGPVETRDILPSNRAGWLTALDVIVAPNAAFVRLREAPTWFWAFLMSVVLGIIGSLLVAPALDHYFSSGAYGAELIRSPQIANLPADQQQKAIATATGIVRATQKFNVVILPVVLLFVAVVQTVIMLLASAITKGKGTFGSLWAAAMNVAIVGFGLFSLINGVIVMIHGSDNFTSTADFTSAVPNLGLLIPRSAVKLHAFFTTFHVFNIWASVLLVIAMEKTALMDRVPAIVTAAILLVCTALFATLAAR